MDGPRKRSGPVVAGPPRSAAAKQANSQIIADRQRQARQRVRAIDRRRRTAAMADELMPMAVHYGLRPLLAVPLGELDSRGRWVA